jgi:polygalacturonase
MPRLTLVATLLLFLGAIVTQAARPLDLPSAVRDSKCLITDHGADPGADDNIKAIKAAINACSGGGTVVIAGGAYKTSPIEVKDASNLLIEVQASASLVTAKGPKDWPTNDDGMVPFVSFKNTNGCGLGGDGVVFGRGGRPPLGTDWYYLWDQGKVDDRPHFIVITGGSNFQLYDLTILDSPSFNVVLDGVNGAEVSGVNITSTWYTDPDSGKLKEPHNTDGIDPMNGAQDIWIHDTFIHNGDDSIAVKALDGDPSTCTRNVVVENCHFELGHGASIGSVGSGCVENVIFRHITMDNMDNGCRIKTRTAPSGRGKVKNITWSNIQMKTADRCVTVTANYDKLSPAKNDDDFVEIKDVTLEHITGHNCRIGAEFLCKESMPCTEITLNDFHVDGGDMNCKNADGTAKDTDPSSCLDN